jgi:hypothetical protein
MSLPIQGDKPLTLNNDRSQGTQTNSKSGSTTATSQAEPIEPTQPTAEVDIERGSQVYSSTTRQTNASSEAAITSSADAQGKLNELKEQLSNPAHAMQAHGQISSEQVAALLHAA